MRSENFGMRNAGIKTADFDRRWTAFASADDAQECST